ncbi:MAG: threonylcarbamoyl-AMP synthase, partial [Phycisphaerales bacterium]|nr:threonylcarbamoyl-AMP synthase [Phycisphaerales bacterium]
MTEILEGPEAIVAAVARLGLGEPIAFPTETVYGLGADAIDTDAVERIFALKGRPANNPLIVHVSDAEMADDLVESWTDQAQQLAEAFWPGSLTLVLAKSESVPDIVTAGGTTVAIRCPAHPVALALIESLGKPIVGPSANPSGWISPTTADHVARGFKGQDLLIIDGGACRAGIESTVLDLTTQEPTILRLGVISHTQITKVLGRPVHISTGADSGAARSPGMLG